MNIDAAHTRRWRVSLFVALLAAGVGYIVAFMFFVRHSVDFIAHARTTAATLAASVRDPAAGGELLFKQGSADLNLLAAGWLQPDGEATWTREGGTLYLPAAFAAGTIVEVRFDGHLNPSDQEMRVVLDVDGTEIGRWHLTHERWQITDRVAIPVQAAVAAARQLRIHVARPERSLWLGYDPALLAYGVHLYYLRVETTFFNE